MFSLLLLQASDYLYFDQTFVPDIFTNVSSLHFINSELKSLFHGVDFILYTLAKFKLIQNFY